MPTYDYRCDACGHVFEHFQSISAPLLRKCPKCRKPKLKRLIGTGGGLVFKGAGFYVTDYRSSAYDEAAKKDQPATPKNETPPASKPDSKPESKKDAPVSSPSSPRPKKGPKKEMG